METLGTGSEKLRNSSRCQGIGAKRCTVSNDELISTSTVRIYGARLAGGAGGLQHP